MFERLSAARIGVINRKESELVFIFSGILFHYNDLFDLKFSFILHGI